MKHTPGPWDWGTSMDALDEGEITINCGDIYGAAVMPIRGEDYPRDEQEANARLIAAAPELLSELIAYHDREWREDHEGIPAHHAGDFPDECGACAVIVKATGGE